jgi:hypothetical protein
MRARERIAYIAATASATVAEKAGFLCTEDTCPSVCPADHSLFVAFSGKTLQQIIAVAVYAVVRFCSIAARAAATERQLVFHTSCSAPSSTPI